MPEHADPALVKLITDALELVGTIEGLSDGTVTDLTAEDLAVTLAPDSAKRDGSVELSISADGMSAEAGFHPPAGDGEPLTLEQVQLALKGKGVVYGIDWTAVTDALERCNSGRVPQHRTVVARGDPPTAEIPQHVVIDAALIAKPTPALDEGSVDHRTFSPFRFVKTGQILGAVVLRRHGIMGTDVRGATVQYRKVRQDAVVLGPGIEAQGAAIVAKRDGRFLYTAGVANVSDVLRVPGDVDYGTGHIDYPGDVVVNGQIKAGFTVKTGGSLVVDRVISATLVSTGDDLLVGHGILGRGEGIVRVLGSIETGFIESCVVEAQKTIHVRTGCLNSAISTLDRLDAGPRGVIVGGTVVAQNGVRAAQIGNKSAVRTEIRCGVDYLVNRKLEWVRDKSMALALKIKEIDRRAGARSTAAVEDARQRLRAAIRALAETARSLAPSLDGNENATITVIGTVYPGAYIEICRVPFLVERPLHHVRIAMSKGQGRIVARPIG